MTTETKTKMIYMVIVNVPGEKEKCYTYYKKEQADYIFDECVLDYENVPHKIRYVSSENGRTLWAKTDEKY